MLPINLIADKGAVSMFTYMSVVLTVSMQSSKDMSCLVYVKHIHKLQTCPVTARFVNWSVRFIKA